MSETILWGDLETYCEIPITNGTHAYAEGVEVMLFAWAIDDGPVSVWDLTAGEPIPSQLRKAIANPDTILYFHNSHFDRTVPDRIVLLPGGRLIFVECKAPGEQPRADQLREHKRLRALGFTVVVLDSKNLEGILCEKFNDAVNSV